jgi:hypothetical protein
VRQHGWSLRQVAEAIHKSPAYVSMRLRVFEADDLRGPVLDDLLSISAAEELLRVPPESRPDLVADAIRDRWTPAQARHARLVARRKCLESKHGNSAPSTVGLEQRMRALSADLQSVAPADLSPSTREEAKRLVALLHILIT